MNQPKTIRQSSFAGVRNFFICIAVSISPTLLQAENYQDTGFLTFEQKPMGSLDKPLILRTFCPDLELDPKLVLGNHSQGSSAPKYSPRSGKEISGKEVKPIAGLPAAIAVNLGKKLSYVWDTTECRLLYAWTDGFLDMKNYWGDKEGGRRKGFNYVPRLFGFVFYKAVGVHPLQVNGKSISSFGSPKYLGYKLDQSQQPVFSFSTGDHIFEISPRIGPGKQTLELTYSSKNNEALSFASPKTQVRVKTNAPGELVVIVRPNEGKRYKTDQKVVALTEATVAKGEELYQSMGCIACHSTDGGLNHGPTFKGLHGNLREFISAKPQKADSDYLYESIKNPSAKTVKGYLAGMMPPYQLQALEYESLVLFIQNLP